MCVDTFLKNPSMDFDQGKHHFLPPEGDVWNLFLGGEHMNFEFYRSY